jgi:hypothetical protein
MPAIPPPPRLQSPTIKPYEPPAPFGFQPQAPGTFTGAAPKAAPVGPFTGQAPTAQPFGSLAAPQPMAGFVAPTPGTLSQVGQFRLDQGQKAIERGAAVRGTLLTGGLQARLLEHGQGVASEEYGNDYQRALQTYETNRGTNAQNFGQTAQTYGTNRDTAAMNYGQERDAYQDLLTSYRTNADTAEQNAASERATFADTLAGYRTNADTTLSANAQGLSAATAGYDRNAATARTLYEDAAADAMRRTGVENTNNAGAYQTQMMEYARQQEEARRAQDIELQRQAQIEQQRRQAEAEQYRQIREQEQRAREGAARQNAAMNAVRPEVPRVAVMPRQARA